MYLIIIKFKIQILIDLIIQPNLLALEYKRSMFSSQHSIKVIKTLINETSFIQHQMVIL